MFLPGNTFKPRKPVIVEFNGRLYTKRVKGYWRSTTEPREYLHRAVWEKFNGPIPKGFDIHHVSEDVETKDDPGPVSLTDGNLELLEKPVHSKRHHYSSRVTA